MHLPRVVNRVVLGVRVKLVPGHLFVWQAAGIAAIRSYRIADMAEIPPVTARVFVVQDQRRHDTHRKIPGDTALYLEKADRMRFVVFSNPVSEMLELLRPRFEYAVSAPKDANAPLDERERKVITGASHRSGSPSLESAFRIARVFGIGVEDVFTWNE